MATAPMRISIAGGDPETQTLAMLTHATIQEKRMGAPGWCKPPDDNALFQEHLVSLEKQGFVERWDERPGWWRATDKAIEGLRPISAPGRA